MVWGLFCELSASAIGDLSQDTEMNVLCASMNAIGVDELEISITFM